MPMPKDTSHCLNQRIWEETAHRVGRDSTGCMATHQEMRVPILKWSPSSWKCQFNKRTPILLLNLEDETSLMQPTSLGSRRSTMPQRSVQPVRTLLWSTVRDAIISILRTSRCHRLNLSSSTQTMITLLPWRISAKTTQASLRRSWTSKSGTTCFLPHLVCRCASEWSEPVVCKDNPILTNMNSEITSECLTHFLDTRKKLVSIAYCINNVRTPHLCDVFGYCINWTYSPTHSPYSHIVFALLDQWSSLIALKSILCYFAIFFTPAHFALIGQIEILFFPLSSHSV